MTSIIPGTAFDPKDVVFGPVEKNKKGGKVVYLGINGSAKTRIAIETPAMVMPFGVTPYQEAAGGDIQSYSVDVSFRTADVDPKVAEFQKRIEAFDELLVNVATENSLEWFGKKMPKELVSEFYRKIVNNKNPTYPPVLKVKVGVDMTGAPSAQFFDETPQHKPVSIEYLGKGSTVKMICEVTSVWFVNKTFGATFRLVQAAVVSKPRRIQGYAFADGAEVEDEPAIEPEEM